MITSQGIAGTFAALQYAPTLTPVAELAGLISPEAAAAGLALQNGASTYVDGTNTGAFADRTSRRDPNTLFADSPADAAGTTVADPEVAATKRAAQSIGRLMIGRFIGDPILYPDVDTGGRLGCNLFATRYVIGLRVLDPSRSVLGFLNSDLPRYLPDIFARTFGEDTSLGENEFFGRMLEKILVFPRTPEYLFFQKLFSHPEGEAFLAASLDKKPRELGHKEFWIMFGLYCLYRGFEMGLVRRGTHEVLRAV